MDPTPADAAHEALDGLLVVVAKAADDLKTFHAAVSQARLAPLPPFPRAAMMMTVRVVDHLRASGTRAARCHDRARVTRAFGFQHHHSGLSQMMRRALVSSELRVYC
jgi:hypothetical protein